MSRLNIKMFAYKYRDSYDKDKTVSFSRHSYHKHGDLIPWKDGLYIETGPWILCVFCDYFVEILTTALWQGHTVVGEMQRKHFQAID